MVPELEKETSSAVEGQVMSQLSEGKAGTLMQLVGNNNFLQTKSSKMKKEDNGEIG